MASKKIQLPMLTSPRGTFKFPRLTTPDTKFNKDGEYGTKILLDPNGKGVQAFLTKLDELTDAAVAQMKEENAKYKKQIQRAASYRNEVDSDGEETGKIEVGVKLKAKITPKTGPNAGKTYELKPALFDAFGQPITGEIRIGGGTEGKVSFEAAPYFAANDKRAGISLRLKAAQVINLVEWTSAKDAKQFGFEDEDEGFSTSETNDTTTTTTDADDEETTDKDGSDF